MNRKTLLEINKRFEKNEKRLKALKVGQLIYIQELADPLGGSYFEHEVVSIDLEEMSVNVLDHSRGGILETLNSFELGSEIGLPDFKE